MRPEVPIQRLANAPERLERPGHGRTVLILGAYGNAGRAISSLAVQVLGADLLLAGRDEERIVAFADTLNAAAGEVRARAIVVDAERDEDLAHALTGVDLVVVAASVPARLEAIARLALAAGSDYLDLWYSPEKSARLAGLETLARQHGRCLITQAGQHPGLPVAMIRWLARTFTRLDSALVASYVRANWGELTFSAATAAEDDEPYDPALYLDGSWHSLDAESLETGVTFDFGPPYGARPCWPIRLGELEALVQQRRDIREAGFLLEQGYGVPAAPPYFALLRAEVIGMRHSTLQRQMLELYHPDGFFLTAASVVACLRQYFSRSHRPGVMVAGLWLAPVPFFRDLAGFGIQIRTERLAMA